MNCECVESECKDQPTMEQSLHSIALSLIEINRKMDKSYRLDRKAHQFDVKVKNVEEFRRKHDVPWVRPAKPMPWWQRLFVSS